MTRKRFLLSFCFPVVLLLLAAAPAAAQPAAPDAAEQVRRMGRGINVLGYDPIWTDFSRARFKDSHFRTIREGGFQTIRINLHAFDHMDPQTGAFDPKWLETLDWAVRNALDAGLMVILDLHNFTDFAKDPVAYKPRFLAFWEQIGTRYRDASPNLVFEVLNEPNGGLTPDLWNAYLKEALALIRKTNPTRTVIVGPAFWNSIDHLDELALPEDDRNLIVTVHYYLPMPFTHQGAAWSESTKNLSGIDWGTDAEKQKVVDDFQRVQAWAKKHGRPIFLGEFGAYDRADMDARVRYTAHVARTAEALGWAWAYWQFDSDFIAFDMRTNGWVEPIHRALIP